ncbi:uncharacterized protein [Nicotiana tomentosiformis]|uniref:uncharacterized protein n=1 Tax=Nicotiana tomentosiformis TaxID=4098 RepID=UPI00388CB52F
MGSLAHFILYRKPLAKEVHRLASLGVRLTDSSEGRDIVQNRAESSLVVEVKEKQYDDPLLVQLKEGIHKHKTMAFSLGMNDGMLRYQGRLCVPNVDGLQKRIMTEAHRSKYFMHPGSTKMYHDLNKSTGEWNEEGCGRLCGEIPKLSASEGRAPEARWFGTKYRNSNVEVGDDQHGLCDRGAQFTANFWQKFQQDLGTQGCCDDHLPLVEFSYNNCYHASIQMASFEALYGKRCRSPIGWFKVGKAELTGPGLLYQAMEKVKIIMERLKTAQSHQKSYFDVRRIDLEFKEDDWVFLKISPMKVIMRFGKKGKLSPRYIKLYRIIQRVCQVAYKLELPPEMSLVLPVFHVSMLKKVIRNP